MKLIIDRVENDYVICETGEREMLSLSKSLFSEAIEDGDIIEYTNGNITFCRKETELRRKKMQERFNDLFQ